MVGHSESNRQWLEWIEAGGVYEQTDEKFALVPMTEFWKTAPAGGEFTSLIPMSQLLTTNLKSTVSMLAQSHTSFLGPKVPKVYEEENNRYKKGIKEVLHSIGYRIGITKSVCLKIFFFNSKIEADLGK
ncbi:MAG: hypothetical protein U5K84_09290 [Alkalibacterium sp.]|nr:hypothetical protein [Alkalibacterium sp.]